MPRRVYRFILKTLKEVSFVGTRYYPVDIDPNLSPYTTVLATIWDEDHMVGQVNLTEILAWAALRSCSRVKPSSCRSLRTHAR
jgi:hypothetical protein